MPNTSSPGLNRVTLLPTASTRPATSNPGTPYLGLRRPVILRMGSGAPLTAKQSPTWRPAFGSGQWGSGRWVDRGEILASAPAPEGCDFFSLHAGRASLKGVIGPIAFFSINTEEMCCNAPHPSFAAEAGARDLETGEPVVLQPEGPSAASISARARDELLRKGGEGCSLNPAEEPAFYTATFHYDENGTLNGHYVYTMSSTYACGSGPDHYSMAGKIIDPALPAGLARWSAAPEWLRERLGSADVAGVSEIPPRLDRDGALAQFKAPVPSPSK